MGSGRLVGNLPGEVTSCGRRRETTLAVRLVRRVRLVTLTGEAAQEREVFPAQVWLVELAALAKDSLLPQTLADILGIHDQPGKWSATRMLANYPAHKQRLVVLDNCEHLPDACAVLASRLLRARPGLRILATSRRPDHHPSAAT